MAFVDHCGSVPRDFDEDVPVALILKSPGDVDMAGIAALSKALQKPVGVVSRAIYQTPSVLMRGIDPRHRDELGEHCAALGLDVTFGPNDVVLPLDPVRYDVGLHVNESACIPEATGILARLLGVGPDKAFRLLATPPGLILGDVSRAAADVLAQRFGRGCTVSAAVSGEGPFDLFLPENARIDRELEERCAGRRGLVMLALDAQEAREIFPRLPKGAARLIPRALLRFDVVLMPREKVAETAVAWLQAETGGSQTEVRRMLAHAPIALREALDFMEAAVAQAASAAAGVPTEIEAHGFLHNDIVVTEAPDRAALEDVLSAAGLNMPVRLPGRIAENLSDLDARWLAHRLDAAGVRFLFQESAQ